MSDNALFDADEYDTPIRLRDRYIVPPFSVLDRRSGWWQGRRHTYYDTGLKSAEGRDATTYQVEGTDYVSRKNAEIANGQSIFDPVLTEIIVRWWMGSDAIAVDPFAGGSVRGVVAGIWGRRYHGFDISKRQIDENRTQITQDGIARELVHVPEWSVMDALDGLRDLDDGYATGGVFTCPPYYDLERYSDHPQDISGWPEARFDAYLADVIFEAYRVQAEDTFAVWVVGNVRNPAGNYRGLVPKTIQLHLAAGYAYYQEAILVDPVGTGRLRAAQTFDSGHKLVPSHQHVLVFLKGDAKRAVVKIGGSE
jgi:hypothetical protein